MNNSAPKWLLQRGVPELIISLLISMIVLICRLTWDFPVDSVILVEWLSQHLVGAFLAAAFLALALWIKNR